MGAYFWNPGRKMHDGLLVNSLASAGGARLAKRQSSAFAESCEKS